MVTARTNEAAHRLKRKSLRWQVSKGQYILLFEEGLHAKPPRVGQYPHLTTGEETGSGPPSLKAWVS